MSESKLICWNCDPGHIFRERFRLNKGMATYSGIAQTVSVEPVERVEGSLSVDVTVESVNGRQVVTDARLDGTAFGGNEKILACKNPEDIPDLTQRICVTCPTAHGLASVAALEKAAAFTAPTNARIMRNLVHGAIFIQSHVLHFYLLSLQDYIDAPSIPPRQPAWHGDKRITGSEAEPFVRSYTAALEVRRKCQEMAAIFGGKAPSPSILIPGGLTTAPRTQRIEEFKTYLADAVSFIQDTYLPDVLKVAKAYQDYFEIGVGYKNLLSLGVFDVEDSGLTKLLKRGRQSAGSTYLEAVDPMVLGEKVTHSWYSTTIANRPQAWGTGSLVFAKKEAPSWTKAPRYQKQPCEVGALARMKINGDYSGGVSVMDRFIARALEAQKIAQAMREWLSQLTPAQAVRRLYTVPVTGSGVGLTEAPRGALGHWLRISDKKTANYQVLTPTCWNASPRDDQDRRGPIEQALINTPIANFSEPVEVIRVVHSFDPCLACSVRTVRRG